MNVVLWFCFCCWCNWWLVVSWFMGDGIMSDLECYQIQMLTIAHLIRCAFDDYALSTIELGNSLKELRKELIE